jgi:DNA-binding CsgD family transcriptional regulator
VSYEHARRAVRIVKELGEVEATERPRHLVESLMGLLGACAGAVVLDRRFRAGVKGGIEAAVRVGFDEDRPQPFSGDLRDRAVNPCLAKMMEGTHDPGHVASGRDDELGARAWQRSVYFNEYARPAGHGRFMCSSVVLGPSHVREGLSLVRPLGDRPFTEDDSQVLRLIQLEAPRVFAAAPMRLAPRLRQTLALVLSGAQDKEIAQRLGLSVHTVHDYVKALRRVFGVSTRGMLVARSRTMAGIG